MKTLSQGNRKLGSIQNFNLPALTTCPGHTTFCKQHCYANKNMYAFKNVKFKYACNLLYTKMSSFAEMLTMEILRKRLPIPIIRIHASGDFFNVDYVKKWIDIVSACKNTKFFAYTRSYTKADLLPSLEELRSLKNMQLFASTDPYTITPPKGWRDAGVDLRVNGYEPKGIVCLEQTRTKKSCVDCGYCFLGKKGDVYFKLH